jgi:hypothetical protein
MMLFPFRAALELVVSGGVLARWSGGLGDPDAAMPGNRSMGRILHKNLKNRGLLGITAGDASTH